MKKAFFAPSLLSVCTAGGLFFGGAGAARAQQEGHRPAIVSYYFALPEDEADGVDFDERAKALQKKSAVVDVRHGFLRVGKVAVRVFHRKFGHDVVAVLKGDDGDSLRLLTLERVQLDSHDQVHDAEWKDETKELLPPGFKDDWKCQLSTRGDSIEVFDTDNHVPAGSMVWTGGRFLLIRSAAFVVHGTSAMPHQTTSKRH